MNAKAKKILKIVLWTLGIIIAIPIVLILTLPLWLGPIARPGINAMVPKITKTSFDIDHLYLNPYTGRLELGDFVMGNPAGYQEPTLVAISNLVFDLDVDTLASKYVHVEDIVVDGLFVSVVKGGENNVDNILQLQYNIAGGKEKYEAAQAVSQEKSAAKKEELAAKEQAAKAAEKAKLDAMTLEQREEYLEEQELRAEAAERRKKKFVIDHVLLRGIKIKYGYVTIPVPVTIELRDLGKKSDGITMSEFFAEVWKAILKSASAVGDGAKALGGMIGDGAGKGMEMLGTGTDKAKEMFGSGTKAVGEGAGKAVDAVKGWFK